MNNSLHERQKAEALRRMHMIGLREDFIRDFEMDDKTHICTFQGTFPALKEEDIAMVNSFECEYHALVYLILRIHTIKGDLDSLLYVGQYTDEWPLDIADLQAGYPLSYVVNHYDHELSEFGSIEIMKTEDGGIIRVG